MLCVPHHYHSLFDFQLSGLVFLFFPVFSAMHSIWKLRGFRRQQLRNRRGKGRQEQRAKLPEQVSTKEQEPGERRRVVLCSEYVSEAWLDVRCDAHRHSVCQSTRRSLDTRNFGIDVLKIHAQDRWAYKITPT